MPENRIKQRLYQMSKDGEVRVVSRGRYELHNLHNLHNQEGEKVTEVTEVMPPHNNGRTRPLTPEQVEQYKRLKAEGMSPEWARAAVLGKESESRGRV